MTTEYFDSSAADSVALEIYDAVSNALATDDLSLISSTLVALERLKREVSEMYDSTKVRMANMMGDSPELSYNGFTFERKPGTVRKAWDHKALSSVVARRLSSMAIDLDTGEILKSPEEMIQEAFNFAGVSYWRVKELNKIGVNADSFCEVSEGKPSIIIRQTEKNEDN